MTCKIGPRANTKNRAHMLKSAEDECMLRNRLTTFHFGVSLRGDLASSSFQEVFERLLKLGSLEKVPLQSKGAVSF